VGPVLARREVVSGIGLAAVAPLLACAREPEAAAAARGRPIAGDPCPPTPRQTEGPYYFDPRLVRRDIREGRPGVPLRLRLQVVGAADCAAAGRARVDIWHCDAAGAYSGYDREKTAGEVWLRGTQFAGADGVVAFETLYPGWYAGRATHIHIKAWTADGRKIVSQIYFPDDLSDRIYAESPYGGRGGRRLRNGDDGLFRGAGGAVPLARVDRSAAGYEGAVVLALR
jgi:protocatechuate 3,4-dioxygenase beta subunit